jgi:hypothetical protein
MLNSQKLRDWNEAREWWLVKRLAENDGDYEKAIESET